MVNPEINPQADSEFEKTSRIRIIDNHGIKRGRETVDVLAYPDRIKEHIFRRIKEVDPNHLDEGRKLVDRLTISFGARSPHDIFMEILDIWLTRSAPSETSQHSIKAKALALYEDLNNFGPTLGGFYFYDNQYPYIYINMGKIFNETDLRKVWDEEVGHFVQCLDPLSRPNIFIYFLQRGALDLGFILFNGVIGKMVLGEAKSRQEKRLSRREFVLITLSSLALFILQKPSLNTFYYFLDSFSFLQRPVKQYIALNPTPMDDFRTLFQVCIF